jgi:hypothetical protein
LRRIPLLPFYVLVPLGIAVALTLGPGCSDEPQPTSSPDQNDNTNGAESPNPNEPRVSTVSDGGAGASFPRRGSPLCNVNASTCMPDEDGVRTSPYGTVPCAKPIGDAGPVLPDAAPYLDACRIVKLDPTTFTPRCFVAAAARYGLDGAWCEKGADCAPGFDCVESEKGSTCRRYCCSGSCEGETSLNGGPTFCDVQKLVEASPHSAPVCMPIKKCHLLAPGECGAHETCAVVTEKGDTGCVARGTAQAGASCDEEHCEADLTCLGAPGDRRCYQLCRTGSPNCLKPQTCTTLTVFQDTAFGICKTN